MINKKIFLILSLLFSTTFLKADEAEIEITLHDAQYISFAATQAPKAWIGIYKAGTTNDWENVLRWDWVEQDEVTFSVSTLPVGDYNARLFFNNSFTTETSVDFHLIERPANNNGKRLFDKTIESYQNALTLTLLYQTYREQDWVGIFEQGEVHTRENLLAWTYISNDSREQELEVFNKNGLAAGTYDIIYFNNDNYNSELGEPAVLTVEDKITYQEWEDTGLEALEYSRFLVASNNWIALFKKDAEPIRENILGWSYIRDGEILNADNDRNVVHFPNMPVVGQNTTLKAVLFKNDTYEIIAETNIN